MDDKKLNECHHEIKRIMKKHGVLFKIVPEYKIELVVDPSAINLTDEKTENTK